MPDFFVGSVKTARAHFLDKGGVEAEVQGDIMFTASDESKVSWFASPPGSRTTDFTMLAPVSGLVVSATADADMGEGVRQLTINSEPFNIVAAEAEGGAVSIE